MLLAELATGTFTLIATHAVTGDTLAKVPFDVSTEWPDEQDGPPLAFVGESAPWVTGGAWGGGPAGVQNVNVMPATGTRRIGVVLVDTSSSRLPTTGTTTADIRAQWANEVVATTPDPDGVLRSSSHYFQEVSDGRFDVSLTHRRGRRAGESARLVDGLLRVERRSRTSGARRATSSRPRRPPRRG